MKIELKDDPRVRREQFNRRFREGLKLGADKANAAFGKDWLDADGSIKMYEHPDRESDQRMIAMKEEQWAREEGKNRESWRAGRDKKESILAEMALTLFLQRSLPPRYLAIRSSTYDDYENGVDHLILDGETGSVVGAIDEVVGLNGAGNKKEEKVRRKMHKGARIKYGARVIEGELILGSISHVPVFYISLDKADLAKLGDSLMEDELGSYEQDLFRRLCASFEEQAESYRGMSMPDELREELEHFKESLNTWNE
ncbi:MAG: hypothetical protein ACM3PZ_02480 [Bacillota bacterium]